MTSYTSVFAFFLVLVGFFFNSLVCGLRLANSSYPTPLVNGFRNSRVQQKAICSTPPIYGAVLTELWSATYPLGSGYSRIVGPFIDEAGFLYIGTNNGIIKLHPFTGTQVGYFLTPSSVLKQFSVFDDRIVFGTGDGQLYSVRLDMTLMWNVSIVAGTQVSLLGSILTDGTRLFFVSDDRVLRAINASNGQLVWTYNLANSNQSELLILGPEYDTQGGWSIMITSNNNENRSTQTPAQVARLESITGTPIWLRMIENNSVSSFTTLPAVFNDFLYAGIKLNSQPMILKVNISSGNYSLLSSGYHFDPITNQSYPNSVMYFLVVTNDEIVYYTRCNQFLCLATTRNFTVLDQFINLPLTFSEPDNLLIYSSDSHIVGIGTQTWTQRLWYDYLSQPISSYLGVVLGNNCTSYIIHTDNYTRSFTVYALRELPLQSIIPIVECVKYKGNNLYTVHFGYNNQQSTTVRIPVNTTKRNEFINPGNLSQSLNSFNPGRSPRYPLSVLTMNVNVSTSPSIVSWILEGNIITINVTDPALSCRRNLSFSMIFTTTVYFNQTHAQALAVAIANFMNISRDRVIVIIISVTSIQKREVKFHSQGSGFNVQVEVTILEGTPQQQQNEPPPDQVITDFLNQLQNNHTVFETQYQNTPGSPPNGISFVLAAPNPTGTEQNGVPLNPPVSPQSPISQPQTPPTAPTPTSQYPNTPKMPIPFSPPPTPTVQLPTNSASRLLIVPLLSLFIVFLV